MGNTDLEKAQPPATPNKPAKPSKIKQAFFFILAVIVVYYGWDVPYYVCVPIVNVLEGIDQRMEDKSNWEIKCPIDSCLYDISQSHVNCSDLLSEKIETKCYNYGHACCLKGEHKCLKYSSIQVCKVIKRESWTSVSYVPLMFVFAILWFVIRIGVPIMAVLGLILWAIILSNPD